MKNGHGIYMYSQENLEIVNDKCYDVNVSYGDKK